MGRYILFILFLIYGPEPFKAYGQTNLSASSRLEVCRTKLKKIKAEAVRLGKLELFEGLFDQATHLLAQIKEETETTEIYFLLGECQGVLESLEFSLNLGKYSKNNRHVEISSEKTEKPIIKRDKRQGTPRPISAIKEPVPMKNIDEEDEETLKDYTPIKSASRYKKQQTVEDDLEKDIH